MSILAAIAVLALLIVVHELGHFVAARAQGIHVNRFSIGFGPILWKYQGAQTEYALRGFPLGGYVGFPDDDPDSDIPPHDPDLLRNRPILDRAIVISAGVIANLIFAYLLLVLQTGIFGIQEFQPSPGVLVPQVVAEKSSAALEAGIQAGDVILAANGEPLAAGQEGLDALRHLIETSPGQSIGLKIQRQQQQLSVQVTPQRSETGKSMIGVQLSPNGVVNHHRSANPLAILATAAEQFQRIFILTIQGFGQLLGNFKEAANQVSGPVAIVAIGAKFARSDLTLLFQFAALISINLAIINILPLPALDGGQLAFLFLEGVRGKPLPHKIQDGVMQTGLVLLLSLGIFLIVRDTANLEWVQNLFQ